MNYYAHVTRVDPEHKPELRSEFGLPSVLKMLLETLLAGWKREGGRDPRHHRGLIETPCSGVIKEVLADSCRRGQ